MSKFSVYRDGRRYYPSHNTLEGALKEVGDQSHPKWECDPYVKDNDTGKVIYREGYNYFYEDCPDEAYDEAKFHLLGAQQAAASRVLTPRADRVCSCPHASAWVATLTIVHPVG